MATNDDTKIGFEGIVVDDRGSPNGRERQQLLESKRSLNGGAGGDYSTLFFKDGRRRIDYILAYDPSDESDKDWKQKRSEKRAAFEQGLMSSGLQLEFEHDSVDQKTHYIKVHMPFERALLMAEEMVMQMPIEQNPNVVHSLLDRAVDKVCSKNPFDPDVEDVPDFFTAPFVYAQRHKFLFLDNEEKFFTPAQRTLMVHQIMSRTPYGDEDPTKIGIDRLTGNQSYIAAYPLHEGGIGEDDPDNARRTLYQVWGSWSAWYKFQPLDHIRSYFGEKIAIYFAWLGYYTGMLFLPAFIGLIVFLVGCAFIDSSENKPAQETCDLKDVRKMTNATNYADKYELYVMCPLCDESCDYWGLDTTCNAARASFLFDNGGTVFFAIVMAFWATFFLEFWKRRQAALAYYWDVMDFEEEEEQPRALFEAKVKTTWENPITGKIEAHQPSKDYYTKILAALSTMVFMILVVIAIIVSVIIYRVAILSLLNRKDRFRSSASFITSITAAIIQLIGIMVMNKIYEYLSIRLTDWELHRTQTEHEDSFTFKMFLFQFVNFYGSIFYIAFFKGRLSGYPGHYNTIAGFRLDECSASGCLIELTQQLAIIMVGKQVMNNTLEILLPRIKVWMRKRDDIEVKEDAAKPMRWEDDFNLADLPEHGLFYEYLEMVIQFGFVTLFVAAFPLAPLFALLNNILEVRVDSNKFATQLRRPLALRAEDIGIWYSVLEAVANLSVITNALVIAITSDFIPRLTYRYGVDDKPLADPDKDTLAGFIEFSLTQVNVSRFPKNPVKDSDFFKTAEKDFKMTNLDQFKYCSFRGFRESDKNGNVENESRFFWQQLCARFVFIIVFEHLVFGIKAIIAWVVPDVPGDIQNEIERQKFKAKVMLREHTGQDDRHSREDEATV